ncbi:MAG: citramalate synthase [Anaerolineae bacterium]|jgi:2-isopropylmalate synthase|nr:citramalate synthase [Chloroflexota bacterium]
MLKRVSVLDTTLRDGAQMEGISFSVDDKLRIVAKLDDLGVAYIEGGWPGSNSKDVEFFQRAQRLSLSHAKIATFSSTRRVGLTVDEDPSIAALLRAGMPVAVIVGKSSAMHVTEVLRTTLDENLAMITDTVACLVGHGIEVIYDAEHFFDGYLLNPQYTLQTLRAAHQAGATMLVLCDTNGGTLPSAISRIVSETRAALPEAALGIHAHNDTGVAVANTLAAVEAGCVHVQGTMNGYGERCGNADLSTVIPNLQLKMDCQALANGNLGLLTETSRYISEIANLRPNPHAPYVGGSAFAHKAGLHVSALLKSADTYQHIDPMLVGNHMRVLVSELAGRSNIVHKLTEMRLGWTLTAEEIRQVAERIKDLESRGYQFESAEGSFELIIRRAQPGYRAPFEVLDFIVLVEKRSNNRILSEATVKARVDGQVMHTAAEGEGPVNALDLAMRKALMPFYPELAASQLTDFKVRIIDPRSATSAVTRVAIDASDGETTWTTVGCSANIIEASFEALIDSLELPLLRRASA